MNDKQVKNAALNGREEVKLRLAHATEESGDFASAEKLYQQVAAQTPDSIETNVELAEFYRRHHQDAKAIDSFNAAVKIAPNNTDIARDFANTYIGIGEPDKALALLDHAITINPRDPLLYNSKGVALDQTGNYTEAQNCYKKAYDLDTTGGTTYKINISMSYILAGSYDKAINQLRPMLDQQDAPPIIRQNLALAYGMKGDNEAALKLGLQDLSDSEAEENVRFYRMLAQKHMHAASGEKINAASLPAADIKDLFTEKEIPVVSTGPAAPVKPVTIGEDMPPPPPKPLLPLSAPAIAPHNTGAENAADIQPTSSVAPDESWMPEPVLKPDHM